MQAIGVLISVAAIWFMYCGTHGVRPIALMLAIVRDPSNAGMIVESAIDAAKTSKYDGWNTVDKTQDAGSMGDQGYVGTNPWAGLQVTAPFGATNHVGVIGSAHVHNGVDYAMPVGTSLPAVIAGTATRGFGILSGTTITVTGTGAYKGWTTIYMHVSSIVKTGGVKAGQAIAKSGGARGAEGSGDSTGPHLHFEVHKNGSVVNPDELWQWIAANKDKLTVNDPNNIAKRQLENGFSI